MVLINKIHLGLDILPKILNQAKSTENIMRTI